MQALDKRYEPFFAEVPGAKGSRRAAVAAATHDVLIAFYAAQFPALAASLDTAYFNPRRLCCTLGEPGLVVAGGARTFWLPRRTARADQPVPDFIGGTNTRPMAPRHLSFLQGPPASFSPMARCHAWPIARAVYPHGPRALPCGPAARDDEQALQKGL